MSNRELATEECLKAIELFLPGSNNREVYGNYLKSLSDDEFEQLMNRFESGEETVTIYAPNFVDTGSLQMEQAFKVAEYLNYPLFQHLYLTDQHTGQVKKTPNKTLVGMVPIRRQVQMLVKKKSIPDTNRIIDQRSGQATSDAKGARMSAPEIQVNLSKGLFNVITEFLKFRGGDETAYNQMNRAIMESGEASLDTIMSNFDTMAKSNKSLSVYLKAMHLQNNLV